jgi:hypothetical protein
MEQEKIELLDDVPGAEHLELKWGERFRGYYLFKTFLRTESLPLESDLTYRFNISKYEVKFVMPPKVEFVNGIISYSLAEREMGIFRYPRTAENTFTSPIDIQKKIDGINKLTPMEVQQLLKAPRPLVFEAYKIPIYGFDYLDISEANFKGIEQLTSTVFSIQMREEFDSRINQLMGNIKAKIENGCNFLLILQNVLDLNWKSLEDLATATENIIRIE